MSEAVLDKRTGPLVNPDPAISIIIPNYNTARYIAETLDSVFAQTFSDYEVVVLNDASPDTEQLHQELVPYLDRIVFVENEKNLGTSATRNLGVEIARGDVISFLDADDIWAPNYLEELIEFLKNGSFDMAYADCASFVANSRPATGLLHLNPEQGAVSRKMLIDGKCHILPSGTLIRKDTYLSVGGFDPGVSRTEDFDLWMRLLFAGKRIGHMKKILFKFRISPGSGSGDAVVRIERSITCWRTLQKKLEFTDGENRTIERHVADLEAASLRAQGRDHIYKKDWKAARDSFKKASSKAAELNMSFRHRIKLKMVILLLKVSPSILHAIYKRVRSGEIEFLPSERTVN